MLGIHQQLTSLPDLVHMAKSIGADTFQFFIRNNRSSRRRSYSQVDLDNFNAVLLPSGIDTYVLHASYCMNPATYDKDLRDKTKVTIMDDLYLLSYLVGHKKYVLHPGSSLDAGTYVGLDNLCSLLEEVKCKVDSNTEICLELMAGAGTQLLSDMQQADYVAQKLPWVKFTLDTCHLYAAGFPIELQMQRFCQYVGVEKLGVVHLNNSQALFNSHVDRHASIVGNHQMTTQSLQEFALLSTQIRPDVPIILETPDNWMVLDYEQVKEYIELHNK